MKRTILVLFTVAACHGCGPPGNGAPAESTPGPDRAGDSPMRGDLDDIVAAALEDAAGRTGLAEDALAVVQAQVVVWRDGSLGCPEPGMAYTQALVPGFRVRIDTGAEVLEYHASRTGRLKLCPPGRATDPLPDDAV